MGLFDIFKTDDGGGDITPHLAFAASLIYVMESDGEIDNEEVGYLLSVLGGQKKGNVIGVGDNNKNLLKKAQNLVSEFSVDQFLIKISPILSKAQKISILINMLDMSLSDGESERQEQEIFGKYMQAFGISEAEFKILFDAIVLKNDRDIFINKNNPKNRDDYNINFTR